MKIRSVVAVLVVGSFVIACGGGGEGEGAKTPANAAKTTGSEGADKSGGPAALPAGSLAEQEVWTKLNEEMTGYIKDANTGCGTSIKGAYDVTSYKGKFKDGESYGVSAYARSSCQSLIQAVRDLCVSGEPGKARVKAKIQKIECKYGSVGQKANVSLSGSTLSGQFDPDAGGATMSEAASDWLKKSL